MTSSPKTTKSQLFSWCLYDWANSVLATIIFTFIFSVYFTRGIVGDEVLGSAYWGYTVGIAGLIIAVLGPILGAISDTLGPRKPLILTLSILTMISTACLFFMAPDPVFIMPTLILVGIATIGFELAQSQYNAMLTDIAPPNKVGRISGWAWAMGYFGGLVCLILALTGFVGLGDGTGFLGITDEDSINVRATAPLAALWFLIFALPLFLFVPDRIKIKRQAGLSIRH